MDKEKLNIKQIWINLKRTWRYSRKYKKYLIADMIVTFISSGFGLVTPILTAQLVLGISNGDKDKIILYGLLFFVISLFNMIIYTLSSYLTQIYNRNNRIEIQSEIAKEILHLEMKEVDQNSSGAFIERLNRDSYEISYIFNSIASNLRGIFVNVGILVSIFLVSKYIFLFMMIIMMLLFFTSKLKINKVAKIKKRNFKTHEYVTSLTSEIVRGIRDIKVLNAEDNMIQKMKNSLILSNEQSYEMENTTRIYSMFDNVIRNLGDFLFLVFSIYLISINKLSFPSMLVLYYYLPRAYSVLFYSSYFIDTLKSFDISAERVFQIVDGDNFEKEQFGTKHLNRIHGDFEFKNVTFAYKKELPVLKNISFKVHANETVAFVGESGGGKSTIFSLLTKLYQIDKGDIFIDGVSIKDLDKNSLRNNISLITQSPYIFNFTIRENLKIVKDDITEEEMIAACKAAQLHDFIMTLPNGYDTMVGENGVILSGGQKQRLAIARALIKKTEIILFDEATSALDNQTQQEIQKAINHMKGEYTILIIAHRLSTVMNSDRIILIDKGKIRAEGTHKELMKTSTVYQNLYQAEADIY